MKAAPMKDGQGIELAQSDMVNGHNVPRIGLIVEGLLNPPAHGVALMAMSAASREEKAIANYVAKKSEKMLRKGYMPEQIAAYAKELATRCAEALEAKPVDVAAEVAELAKAEAAEVAGNRSENAEVYQG